MLAALPFHASQQNPHDFVAHQLAVDRKTGRAYVKTTLTARQNGRQTNTKRELREFFAAASGTEVKSLLELVGYLTLRELQQQADDAAGAR